mgnify:CR=1 FL=1
MHFFGYYGIPRSFSLDYHTYEVSENSNYRSRDKYKNKHPGDAFFKVCVLPKKMACIEQEADQKDDP